jgi:hypothetical protein
MEKRNMLIFNFVMKCKPWEIFLIPKEKKRGWELWDEIKTKLLI